MQHYFISLLYYIFHLYYILLILFHLFSFFTFLFLLFIFRLIFAVVCVTITQRSLKYIENQIILIEILTSLFLFFYFTRTCSRVVCANLRYVRHRRYARPSRIEFSTLRPTLTPCTRTLAIRIEYRNALRPPRYRNPGVNALRINESGVAISCELLDVRARGL